MADLGTVQNKIQGLIDLSNTKTGNNDTTLTAAVNSLADGYGKGENRLGAYLNKRLKKITSADFPEDGHLPEGFFRDQIELVEVDVSDSDAKLNNELFFGCTSLKNLKLRDMANPGDRCFWGCDLSGNIETTSTKYYGNVKLEAVGREAFAYTNIKFDCLTVSGQHIISNYAFSDSPGPKNICMLATNTAGFIGEFAFSHCNNVESLWIGTDTPHWSGTAVDYEEYPEEFHIGDRAFFYSSLKNVYFMGPVFECFQRLYCHRDAFKDSAITEIICSDGRIPVSEVNTYD